MTRSITKKANCLLTMTRCVVAGLLVSASCASYAEVINNIKLIGNKRIESQTIQSYISIRPGDNVTDETMDAALKTLFETGFFHDVKISRSGQTVIVEVEENPILNKIVFEGNDKIKDDQLLSEIQMRPREVFSRAKVQGATQRILEIYRALGRFGATVEAKIVRLEENRVNLIFEINEGDVTYIRNIKFMGNRAFSSSKLESAILSKKARWYRFFASDDTYDPGRFMADQQILQQYYNDHGYPDVKISSAVAELSPDHKDFFLTFTIQEGVYHTFGDIRLISEIKQISTEAFQNLLECHANDMFSNKMIERTVNRLTDALGAKGFAFAQVEPEIKKNAETQKVNVTFKIMEGPRVYIERIDIIGNDRTRDEVIRREIPIQEGDAYNSSKIKRAEGNLKDLNYFKTVTIETEQGTESDTARLVARVEEQPTGEIGVAGGYSTMDGPLGNIKFVERNFMGKGQIINADLTVAKRKQDFSVGFTEPHFLNRDLLASVDVFATRMSRFNNYSQSSKGMSFGLGYRLADYLGQSLNYSIHDDRISGVSDKASSIIKSQAGNTITSAVGQSISYDRRDSRINPTSGYVVSLSNTYAGVGGDVSYLRNTLGGSWFASPIEDVVCNVRGSVGGMEKTGKVIRVVDSIMLGADSFRGFQYGGLGARDLKTGDSLGGTRYWTGTAEVLFPIGLPNEVGVKGACFTDVGAMWKPGQTNATVVDDKKVRASVGVGISWVSPLGPIRLDYAIPVKKQAYDRVQRFLFGFSTRF